jgi:glutathione peroxidase-family protein
MSKIYDLTMNSIEGEPVALDQYRGKVSLVVNVASA